MYIRELNYSGADKNKTTDVTTDQNTDIPCGEKVQWRGRELLNSWRNVNIKHKTTWFQPDSFLTCILWLMGSLSCNLLQIFNKI